MSDVVIVGAGVIGTSTAYALLQRGVTDITILERNTVAAGGTGKSAGIVRCHYGVTSVAALALASLEFFENAKEILGADIGFEQVGYLVGVGAENREPFTASVKHQQSLGVPTEFIDHDAVRELWPTAYLDDFDTFCWEPRGGYGDGYATAQGFAAYLRDHGVTIRQGAEVVEVLTEGTRATGVKLADGEIVPAGTVILAGGPWVPALTTPLGIDVPIDPILNEQVLINPGMNLGASPVFSDLVSRQDVQMRKGELLFGYSDASRLIKSVSNLDDYPGHASHEALEAVAEKAVHRFPGIENPQVVSTFTGVFDSTPDQNYIISGTDYDGLFLETGMSGHGFKTSPAIGKLAAELILDGDTTIPNVTASDFRLSRFAEGDLLTSPFPYKGASGIR
ncbi:MAG: FAD-binding oxidoreductase [Acidipropionibacterium sp.]|jgi:glycine/D-amino acid oxidase-like deaminating enzyme|nr:FAD-binding oxidoreductase [Acidipropionibacterium sp.]